MIKVAAAEVAASALDQHATKKSGCLDKESVYKRADQDAKTEIPIEDDEHRSANSSAEDDRCNSHAAMVGQGAPDLEPRQRRIENDRSRPFLRGALKRRMQTCRQSAA